MADVTLRVEERKLFARISCELDHHTAKCVREQIDAALFEEKPDLLILDFSGVPFMDSSGVGLVLGRLAVARDLGGAVRIEGLSRALYRLVHLSGIERLPGLTVRKERDV